MDDLTPKVIGATDTTTYERGTGTLRAITRVTYMLGALGPFQADFERGTFTDQALRDAMDAKARALQLHV